MQKEVPYEIALTETSFIVTRSMHFHKSQVNYEFN